MDGKEAVKRMLQSLDFDDSMCEFVVYEIYLLLHTVGRGTVATTVGLSYCPSCLL
jgi:hypothetical protein